MKKGFYLKFALDGIKKNKKLSVPYIISSVGMVMMFYIISFLSCSKTVSELKGGSNISEFLNLGSFVIAVFSLIFLFYTNSFFMKQRKKEFGLYNILGLSKPNIGKIIILENLLTYTVSVIGGLFFGIILSKACELAVTNIMHGEITQAFNFTAKPFINSALIFAFIYFVLTVHSLRSIKHTNPSELLKSQNTGEKVPKAKIVPGIIGFIILGGAYCFAITVKSPISALLWFFVAVIAVIVATYLIFVSGSVLICSALKKNKKYYYKTNHFVSVSQMMFRMKRSGVGLASICILATMVLVMMASSSSLYFGSEEALTGRYPFDLETTVTCGSYKTLNENKNEIKKLTDNYLKKENVNITGGIFTDYTAVTGLMSEKYIELDPVKAENSLDFKNLCTFCFFTEDDYNRLTGEKLNLKNDEVYINCYRKDISGEKTLNFCNSLKLNIKGEIEKFFVPGGAAVNIADCCLCVIKDYGVLKPFENLKDFSGKKVLVYNTEIGYNTDASEEKQIACCDGIATELKNKINDDIVIRTDSLALNRNDFYGTFGGIFFLGIMLSLIFMFATVMIIYYKQITEGYEDANRFDVMQKVGMTKKEIKKSINSQMLTVFFLPLLFSVFHLSASFPAIRKILMLFNLTNTNIILLTTVITVAVFAVFYTVVYKITSNEYYKIVSK